MKMLTLVFAIATSASALALTAPTTTSAKMNKAIQKKAAKKAASEIQTTETPVEQTTSSTLNNVVVPATGTSTTAAPAAAPQNDFGGSITSDTTADQSAAQGTESIQSVTTIAGRYQISETSKAGLSQSFETGNDTAIGKQYSDELNKNNFRAMFFEASINKTLLNFAGTERTTFDFRTRFYNRESFSILALGLDRHYNISSFSNIAFTPKFSGTLYNEFRIFQLRDGSAMPSRFSVLPSANYAINDALSFYQIAGFIMNTRDGAAFSNQRERMYIETGVNYAPAALAGFNINLLVYQDKMIASQAADEKVSSLSIYDATNNNDTTKARDIVAYEAILNYSF